MPPVDTAIPTSSSAFDQDEKSGGLFDKYQLAIEDCELIRTEGEVVKVKGLLIYSVGPIARIGELCEIVLPNGEISKCEVVGFDKNFVNLLALDNVEGIVPGSKVYAHGKPLTVSVGDGLMGRILDGLGNPIDGQTLSFSNQKKSILNKPPDVLKRNKIEHPIQTGIKAIDGLLTVGQGQRIGVFSGTGVGKSTVLSMIARETNADLNVICLVGERGREVREFIERDLGEEGLKRSIIVVATTDVPALTRVRSLYVATTIAEHFRDQGKNVMLMVDSVTRFAMAQREIGSLLGEPPTIKAYCPSVFSMLAQLLERSGNSSKGSITAFYTVLVEGDDMDDPIADAVRGVLDGHIVLSRRLATMNHYPAIDITQSISRLMPYIIEEEHYLAASKIKEWVAHYRTVEDLLNIGTYVKGENLTVDEAISKIDEINQLVKQGILESIDFESTKKSVIAMVFGSKKDPLIDERSTVNPNNYTSFSNLSSMLKPS